MSDADMIRDWLYILISIYVYMYMWRTPEVVMYICRYMNMYRPPHRRTDRAGAGGYLL